MFLGQLPKRLVIGCVDSDATFGHEQWYILHYYYSKKKRRGCTGWGIYSWSFQKLWRDPFLRQDLTVHFSQIKQDPWFWSYSCRHRPLGRTRLEYVVIWKRLVIGCVESDATFGHEQWYTLYYYYSKEKRWGCTSGHAQNILPVMCPSKSKYQSSISG
jgi:hypothetical protein